MLPHCCHTSLSPGRMSSPQEHLDRVLAGSKESMGSISEVRRTEGQWVWDCRSAQ